MTAEGVEVRLRRSGGFGGMTLETSVNSRDLPPEEARGVEQLLERGEAALHDDQPPARGADRFQYDLTMSRGDEKVELSFSDGAIPPDLESLVGRLVRLARRR
jgi:hypothetical protein